MPVSEPPNGGAASIFRDMNGATAHQPRKGEVRSWGGWIENMFLQLSADAAAAGAALAAEVAARQVALAAETAARQAADTAAAGQIAARATITALNGAVATLNAADAAAQDQIARRATVDELAAEVERAMFAEDVQAGRTEDEALLARSRSRIAQLGARGAVSPGMPRPIYDRLGRMVGWDSAGRTVSGGHVIHPDRSRGAGRWLEAFRDAWDRLALGVEMDGGVTIPELRQPLPTARGAVGRWVSILRDRADRVLIGWQRGWLNPMAVGVGTWRDPAEIAGGWPVSNVRLGPQHLYATLHEEVGGYTCDVMQRPGATNLVPVEAGRRARGLLIVAQSGGGAGSGPAGPLPLPYGHRAHALMTGWYGAYGDADHTASIAGYADLQPAAGPWLQAYAPGLALSDALADLDMQAGRRCPGYISWTSWEGSQPLQNFFPGTPGHWLHENAAAGVAAMIRSAAGYRGADLAAVLLIQGEAGASSSYATMLASWIDTVAPLYAAAAGQSAIPHVLFRQTSIPANATGADPQAVAQAQLAVARARLGSGVTMTGPMYHLPLHDTLHADNVGRLIGAEQDAVALHHAVTLGQTWWPLWPVAGGATRSGAVIRLPMQLPPVATGLALDDDWVSPVPNRGLVYSDAGSGASIQSVALDGSDLVITLTANPGSAANKRISYALYQGVPVEAQPGDGLPGWAGGRGQIYARTDIASPAWRRGRIGYPTIRLYSMAFQETVA